MAATAASLRKERSEARELPSGPGFRHSLRGAARRLHADLRAPRRRRSTWLRPPPGLPTTRRCGASDPILCLRSRQVQKAELGLSKTLGLQRLHFPASNPPCHCVAVPFQESSTASSAALCPGRMGSVHGFACRFLHRNRRNRAQCQARQRGPRRQPRPGAQLRLRAA